MKKCIDCGVDISYKTSNNVKRCTKCLRSYHTDHEKIKRINKTMSKVRHDIVVLYNGCAICGWKITKNNGSVFANGKWHHTHGCELHHIIPVSKGGIESFDNLILLCPNCHKQADMKLISDEKLKSHLIPTNAIDKILEQKKSDNIFAVADLIDKLF